MQVDEMTSIKQMLQVILEEMFVPISIEVGVVKSASPLKLGLKNNSKMTLTSVDLVIPQEMSSKLTKGKQVYLIVINNGKQYYVAGSV